MTRPDSNSSDQSANQDDAVWLDLVARLEGSSGNAPEAGNGEAKANRPFRDFDPWASPVPPRPSCPRLSGGPSSLGRSRRTLVRRRHPARVITTPTTTTAGSFRRSRQALQASIP